MDHIPLFVSWGDKTTARFVVLVALLKDGWWKGLQTAGRGGHRGAALFMSLVCESVLSQTRQFNLQHSVAALCGQRRRAEASQAQFASNPLSVLSLRLMTNGQQWSLTAETNKVKYGCERPPQHPLPMVSFPVILWTTSGRCVTAAVLEKLCSRAKRSRLSCPVMGHLGTYVKAQLLDDTNNTHVSLLYDC